MFLQGGVDCEHGKRRPCRDSAYAASATASEPFRSRSRAKARGCTFVSRLRLDPLKFGRQLSLVFPFERRAVQRYPRSGISAGEVLDFEFGLVVQAERQVRQRQVGRSTLFTAQDGLRDTLDQRL